MIGSLLILDTPMRAACGTCGEAWAGRDTAFVARMQQTHRCRTPEELRRIRAMGDGAWIYGV